MNALGRVLMNLRPTSALGRRATSLSKNTVKWSVGGLNVISKSGIVNLDTASMPIGALNH